MTATRRTHRIASIRSLTARYALAVGGYALLAFTWFLVAIVAMGVWR
jgi:hypothetical protein